MLGEGKGWRALTEVQTVYQDGAWHFKDGTRRDNIGDYTMGVVAIGDRKFYVLMARMGTPPPGGAFWWSPYDGDPYNGWTQGEPPGSMPEPPIKALPKPLGTVNIDTHAFRQNPATQVITWVHSVKDGRGFHRIERATSRAIDPHPAAYQRFAEPVILGGLECSLVIDPYKQRAWLYYVIKSTEEPDIVGVQFRVRVWRVEIDLHRFDEDFRVIGVPEMVYSPDQDGQGPWGTAFTVLQPAVEVLPGGIQIMSVLGKEPIGHPNGEPAIGKMNATTAINLLISKDDGATWAPHKEGVPFFDREFLGLKEGIANAVNSGHFFFDLFSKKLYWTCARNQINQVNQLGTRIVMTETQL